MLDEVHSDARGMVADAALDAMNGTTRMGTLQMRSLMAQLAVAMLPHDKVLTQAAEHAKAEWRDNVALPPARTDLAERAQEARSQLTRLIREGTDPTAIAMWAAGYANYLKQGDPVMSAATDHATNFYTSTRVLRGALPESLEAVAVRAAARSRLDPENAALKENAGHLRALADHLAVVKAGTPEDGHLDKLHTNVVRSMGLTNSGAREPRKSINDSAGRLFLAENGALKSRDSPLDIALELERRVDAAVISGNELRRDRRFRKGQGLDRPAQAKDPSGYVKPERTSGRSPSSLPRRKGI